MERMLLGRTGLEVYRLGLGGIPIQRVSEVEAVETVRHALERGVDFIDTSRIYTTSERRIGLALRQAGIQPGRPGGAEGGPTDRGVDAPAGRRVVLASKSPAPTAEGARADLETSLRELQVDYIDLYQCHFVVNEAAYQTVIGPGGALEALRAARDEGLIGHVGITSHSLDVLERAVDDGLFDTIMVCFGLLEPAAGERVIPKAVAKDIGVLAMKPFSGGVVDDARLAIKFSLSEPGVLVLAGVERPDLFDENWRVFAEGGPLTETEKGEITSTAAAPRQGVLPTLRLLPALFRGYPHPDSAGAPLHGATYGPGGAAGWPLRPGRGQGPELY